MWPVISSFFFTSALAVAAADALEPRVDAPAEQSAPARAATQAEDSMRISITLGDTTLLATLNDTPTARVFASLLPLTMRLEDYAQSEKIGYPPRKLTTPASPAGLGGSAGTIAYYAPWGNLAFYYRDFRLTTGWSSSAASREASRRSARRAH